MDDARRHDGAGSKKVRVVLADDHELFRRGVAEMLATDEGIEVVGEAADGAEAVALAGRERPDVVVLDAVMPVMGGAEALALMLGLARPPGVVVLTMLDERRLARGLAGSGASAFLPKSASLGEIVAAVRAARRGPA